MQQQLAVMRNSSSILAASSWPACGCLTSLTQSSGMPAFFITTALQTTSLVNLQILVNDAYPAASMPAFQQLSTLTRLTQLTFSVSDRSADELQLLLTASAQVSSLQQLEVTASCIEPAAVASLPLSNAPRLTQLQLRGLRMDLASLSRAPALSCLDMLQCTGLGSLTSLFRLTSLTHLGGPEGLSPRPHDPAAATASEAPAAWRQGLQSLRWPGLQADSWPRVVQQLSSLTQLCMTDVCVSPAFCRWVVPRLPRRLMCSCRLAAHHGSSCMRWSALHTGYLGQCLRHRVVTSHHADTVLHAARSKCTRHGGGAGHGQHTNSMGITLYRSPAQHSTTSQNTSAQHSIASHCSPTPAQHSIAQYRTAQHNIAEQNSSAQHSTMQRSQVRCH
jgi:hypothetical protein